MLDMNQKNLKTKRIVPADTSQAWTYVTLSSRYRPARYKHSLDTGLTTIACVALDVRAVKDGGTGTNDVLHFRAHDAMELREIIEKAFPNAVFSTVNPEPSLKEQHAAEVKEAKAAADKEQEEYQLVQRVTTAHRQIASEMTPQQLAEATAVNLGSFIRDSDWYKWFREHREGTVNFLDFPNGEGRNRATLLAICNHRGQILPLHGELDAAMRYGLANNHFYLRDTYKRSEQDEMHAVKQYTGDVPNARVSTFSDEQVAEAKRRLRQALPQGIKVPEERIQATAKELGISQSLLDAVMGRTGSLIEANDARRQVRGHLRGNPKPDVSNLSAKDLKAGLAALRPPVDPNRRRQGY